MSSDTITTALFLITAVIAAGVLINAIYPVVFNMAGTFTTATHESDQRLRTDFKNVLIAANGTTKLGNAWLKNTGSAKISLEDIKRSDVFCGAVGDFKRLDWTNSGPITIDNTWTATIKESGTTNNYWDPGETLEIAFGTTSLPADASSNAYFQFVLPNGIWRSSEFTVT